jgi:thiamine-phosphate pyrophosphorylase
LKTTFSLTAPQMKDLRECRLYAFVDLAYLNGRIPEDLALQLCEGGSDLIQLRAKGSSPEEILRLAEAILPITDRFGVGLVINDYPEIASKVGAQVCHLGQEDFFDARHALATEVTGRPPKFKLGLSTHAPEQALRAITAEPDYIAIGPIFPTGTKPTAPPVTLKYVRWAAANVTLPWFAIGGITLNNLDEVLGAGATRICVVSAILNAPDVARACQQFRERLPSAPR